MRVLSTDKGAALAVLGYQLLTNEWTTHEEVERFIDQIEPYVANSSKIPHLQRFHVSLGYLKGQLLTKIGRLNRALTVLTHVANADIANFSPTLGTKIVDAAFESGVLETGRGNIDGARLNWKLGVERAYALLASDIKEFVGDLSNPHEFVSIIAVELLDLRFVALKR